MFNLIEKKVNNLINSWDLQQNQDDKLNEEVRLFILDFK